MITVTTDFSAIVKLTTKLKELRAEIINNKVKELAASLIPIIRNRVHVEGKLADGSLIGNYNDDYLKLREKRGRSEGNKVVLSFNRNMENALKVIAIDNSYGIGIIGNEEGESTIAMIELVRILEKKYGIFYGLSKEEKQAAIDFINKGIVDAFENI